MELKLKQNRGFYSQKNIIANEQIELVSDIDSKFDVYITFKNNDIKARIKVNHVFSIPAEVFIDGILESNVEVYFQGNLIKRIPCDRLIIQNVDNSLKAIPEIEKLKEDYKNQLNDIDDKVKKLSDKLDFFIKLWKEGI